MEGYRSFTEEWEQQQILNGLTNGVCSLGEKCCKNIKNGTVNQDDANSVNGVNVPPNESLFDSSEFKPYDPSQEPIFPPELQVI